MNVLLTLFARSVQERIYLRFFRIDIAPSLLDLYENLKYFPVQPTPPSRLINLQYLVNLYIF